MSDVAVYRLVDDDGPGPEEGEAGEGVFISPRDAYRAAARKRLHNYTVDRGTMGADGRFCFELRYSWYRYHPEDFEPPEDTPSLPAPWWETER
jgi:hypothetical protein